MIHIEKEKVKAIAEIHFQAVKSRLKAKSDAYRRNIFEKICQLPGLEEYANAWSYEKAAAEDEWGWLEQFILVDVSVMRKWVEKCPGKLKFEEFKKIYLQYFSNGSTNFVDTEKTYNAYTFLKKMGISVCPYCEEEYLHILTTEDEKQKRTVEVEHFFPKGEYPALAMCFYNLIPSGKNCNNLKMEQRIGMNPYEEEIESCTYLYPDLPVGINMEMISADDCKVKFHPVGGMKDNVGIFLLEQRYEMHRGEAYRLLKRAQQFDSEKLDELVKMGMFGSREEAEEELFGPLDEEEKKRTILQKMKKDLTGY